MTAKTRRAYAYIRLSRDDLKQPGSLDEKFALRAVICRRIAQQNGLDLADDDILAEQQSGSKLSTRPHMQRLVQMAREKHLPHLITPAIDRLLRGDKRDEQEIEDALCIGETIVYTTEGDPIRFGPDYDPTLFEFKALGARMELRSYIKRRRETNLAKVEQGKRYAGVAPYGYRYLRATFDPYGRQLTSARHEADPEEFEIAREIFRRLFRESSYVIAADLNERGVRAPSAGKRANAATIWRPSTIRAMMLNPFYAGYISHRSRVSRGKVTNYKPEDFILAAEPGDWPAVLTLEEWRELLRIVSGRTTPGAGEPLPLSGILYNSCGRLMWRNYSSYRCGCDDKFAAWESAGHHPGMSVYRPKIEQFAREVVTAVLKSLPPDLFAAARRPARSRQELRARILHLTSGVAERRRQVEEMMLRRAYFTDLYGKEMYESAAARVAGELRDMEGELARLRSEADQPDIEQVAPLIDRIRALGGPEAIAAAPADLFSDLTHALIARIDMVEPPDTGRKHAFHREARVTLWDWAAAFDPEMPALQVRYYTDTGQQELP